MKHPQETNGRLTWRQARLFSRRFDLTDGTDVVATLELQGMSKSALGASAGGSWRFLLEGFSSPRMICKDARLGHEIASFESRAVGRNGIGGWRDHAAE